MRKITGRDFDYLLNALIIALVVMAVLHSIAPIVNHDPNLSSKIEAHVKDVEPLRPVAMETMLHSAEGKPSMLVIYATWCGYCRKLLPEITQLIHDKQLGDIRHLFLALDDNPQDVSKYVVSQGYETLFKPYIIAPDTSSELRGVLAMTGSGYKGHIPYVGFFNHEGKLVAETFGMVDKGRLLENIRKVAKH